MTAVTRRSRHLLTCVILAAGGSSRLGRPKQLVRFRTRALLRRAVDAGMRATGRPAIIVVGAEALRLRALLRRSHPMSVVVNNAGWRIGLAGSLRAGVGAVPMDARAVLFMLSDQPHVDAGGLSRLIAAWSRRPGRCAAARYAGGIGVPAILPRPAWRRLRELSGDVGARKVLEATPALTIVDMPEAAADVDTQEHLAALGCWAVPPSRVRPWRS